MGEKAMNKNAIHKQICDDIHTLYEDKNRDYGDSMKSLYDEYGITAFMILFEIKLNRIKSLTKNGSCKFELIEDSIRDLANYAIILLTEIQDREQFKEE